MSELLLRHLGVPSICVEVEEMAEKARLEAESSNLEAQIVYLDRLLSRSSTSS